MFAKRFLMKHGLKVPSSCSRDASEEHRRKEGAVISQSGSPWKSHSSFRGLGERRAVWWWRPSAVFPSLVPRGGDEFLFLDETVSVFYPFLRFCSPESFTYPVASTVMSCPKD